RPGRSAGSGGGPSRDGGAGTGQESTSRFAVSTGLGHRFLDVDAVAESPNPRAMLLAELADFVTATVLAASSVMTPGARAGGLRRNGGLLLRRRVHAVGDAAIGGAGAARLEVLLTSTSSSSS